MLVWWRAGESVLRVTTLESLVCFVYLISASGFLGIGDSDTSMA